MLHRMRKTAAQLEREITQALAATPAPKNKRKTPTHHVDRAEVFDLPEWHVIKDALLEHNAPKAAAVWRQLREERRGDTPRPESFRRAIQEVPSQVRRKFEDLTARTADLHIEAIRNAYLGGNSDALIAAVRAANKHAKAMKGHSDSSGSFDASMYELANLLVDANKSVKNIKKQRGTSRRG